jgi:hypothetical protein
MGCSTTLEELIARQRSNLNRTFAQTELSAANAATVRRLARTQHELAEATAEFTEGIEARIGPVPCLHDALDAMRAAAATLDKTDVKAAAPSEEAALANLIKARRNLRKALSDANSRQAQACRAFDLQQQDKIRRPPKKKDEEEQKKLQEEIQELARQQRKFSEEIASRGGNCSQEMADRQEKAAEKAAELKQEVRSDDALTELARERMTEAAEAVKASAQAAKGGKGEEARKQAAAAADELERLAAQVAALKSPDLAAKLAAAQSQADDLARQQDALGRELQTEGRPPDRQAERQEANAEDARTLADLLERLKEDAAEANAALGQALKQAEQEAAPAEIARQMRQAAEALKAGDRGPARRDAPALARRLDELAQRLDAARRGFVQPQLDRLLAAEKQAAGVQRAMDAVKSEGQKAEVERQMTELRDNLQGLGQQDGKLAEAAEAVGQTLDQVGGRWTRPQVREGLYQPPELYRGAVRRAITALQARIQEIILKDALLDRDEPVPPRYKKLVEEYYRMLSEDIR